MCCESCLGQVNVYASAGFGSSAQGSNLILTLSSLGEVLTLDGWCDDIVRHVVYRQPVMGVADLEMGLRGYFTFVSRENMVHTNTSKYSTQSRTQSTAFFQEENASKMLGFLAHLTHILCGASSLSR